MFPMNESVRKNVEAQIALSTKVADQMVDWQAQSLASSQKHFNAAFDAMRSMMDLQQKAGRAMQQTMIDGMFKAATPAA
jgi:hypothetical protein